MSVSRLSSAPDVVVLDVTKSDRSSVLVDEADGGDGEGVETHSLCTSVGLEALDWVQGLKRSVDERVKDVEEEVGRNGSLSNGEVLRVVRFRGPFGRKTSVNGEPGSASKGTVDEQRTARGAIGNGDTDTGCGESGGVETRQAERVTSSLPPMADVMELMRLRTNLWCKKVSGRGSGRGRPRERGLILEAPPAKQTAA